MINLFYNLSTNIKGSLEKDKYFKKDPTSYRENTDKVLCGVNIALWLEYFAQAVVNQLEKALIDALQQKILKVLQITASRDLARLTTLDLLFYYEKRTFHILHKGLIMPINPQKHLFVFISID